MGSLPPSQHSDSEFPPDALTSPEPLAWLGISDSDREEDAAIRRYLEQRPGRQGEAWHG